MRSVFLNPSFSEKLCLALNRMFKPSSNYELLRNDPSEEGKIRYSSLSARNHLATSLDYLNPERAARRIPAEILDLGCGYGGLSAALAERGGLRVTGVDLNLRGLTVAHRHIQAKQEPDNPPHFVLADAEKLPFTAEKFDLIYTIATMEHFDRPRHVLQECSRVLRKDGRLYIHFSPYYAFMGAHLFDFIHIPWCHLLFSEKTLLRVWKRLAAKSPELAKLNTSVDQERNRFIGINKTSVRKFKRLIQDSDFRRLVYKEIAFQRWYLKALHKIPLLKEVLTIEIIAVLKKENESHRDGLVEIS